MAAAFDSGQRVSAGEPLLQIDDTTYRQALAVPKTQLAEANVAFLEAQRQAAQAEAEWKLSGVSGQPDSPLVLRQPQLTAAKTHFKQAEATVAQANRDLGNTRIEAPYDVLVIDRNVSPGGLVQAGVKLGTLYSVDQVEISLPLNARQWQMMPSILSKIAVTLVDQESGQQWSATARRVELHRDSQNRQRSLVVSVERPYDQENMLLPGSFVRANLTGKTQQDLIAVPASAITGDQKLWQVEANQLRLTAVKVAFYQDDMAYIEAGDNETMLVIIRPGNRYRNGQTINAVLSNGEPDNEELRNEKLSNTMLSQPVAESQEQS